MSIHQPEPSPLDDSLLVGPTGPEGLTAPVKLVIWDLDETLWSGTLSEETVRLDQSRIDLVRALNRRGIVNSICSKNDAQAVRLRLEEAGIWQEFVFASVDWSPKGGRVAQIIENMQLRAESVLFIDDLLINRGEVRSLVPEIQTASPDIIDHLLSLPQCKGKSDEGLTRLGQYQLIERKHLDHKASTTSNIDFLRSCAIRAGIFEAGEDEQDRLFELVNRTNQLNFTKRRPSETEFAALLQDPDRRTGYVAVRDRYGDYGICGFFSLSDSGRQLDDFLFSCRVLNMGVEQWVYDQLGRPSLTVVGEVASTLEDSVDWITLDAGLSEVADAAVTDATDRGGPPLASATERVLMVGGCDLRTTTVFLGGAIDTDFHRTADSGALIHPEHTDFLRQAAVGLTDEQRSVVDGLPFLDLEIFDPSVLKKQHDLVIYSLLMDMTQDRYRHRDTGLVVAWHQLDVDATNPASWPSIEKRYGTTAIDDALLARFSQEFDRVGALTTDQFKVNIRWLSERVGPSTRLIFLNGAELPIDSVAEPRRHLRHQQMNEALDQVVAELPNATVCDVRNFVLSEEDLSRNDLRHYRRHVYKRIAEEIKRTSATSLELRKPKVTTSVRRSVVWKSRRFLGQSRRRLLGKPE